jgi:hypothetical protein
MFLEQPKLDTKVMFDSITVHDSYRDIGLGSVLFEIAMYLLQFSNSIHVASFLTKGWERFSNKFEKIGYQRVKRIPEHKLRKDLARFIVITRSSDYNRQMMWFDYREQ